MKKFLIWVCLAMFLAVGVCAALDMATLPPTYDSENASVSAYELMQNPEGYDVTSIVFDFRGYDTMGESFIMILTVSAVIVLLRKTKEEKEKLKEERNAAAR